MAIAKKDVLQFEIIADNAVGIWIDAEFKRVESALQDIHRAEEYIRANKKDIKDEVSLFHVGTELSRQHGMQCKIVSFILHAVTISALSHLRIVELPEPVFV
jgi:hypothetical protein